MTKNETIKKNLVRWEGDEKAGYYYYYYYCEMDLLCLITSTLLFLSKNEENIAGI